MYGYPFPALSTSINVTTNYPATTGVLFELEELEEFNNYTISVAAVNSNGTGPYTANITVQTQPDGKYIACTISMMNKELYLRISFPAPSGAPTNISISVSGRTLYAVWYPPVATERNGIITSYDFTYIGSPIDTNTTVISVSAISDQEANIVLSVNDIEEFNSYTIRIIAVNSVGVGTQSDAIVIQTPSDGEL